MIYSSHFVAVLGFLCQGEVTSFSLKTNLQSSSSWRANSALSSSIGSDIAPEGENKHRQAEFIDLEPVHESDVRRARLERDTMNKEQFAKYGNELWDLRQVIQSLSSKLVEAINTDSVQKEQRIREKLRGAEQRDPELMYKLETAEGMVAQRESRTEDAQEHSERALAARSCLPQYNLEGLWVGKYGHHGYEMINVTYAGDHLIAYKVTGDKNVPKGEITFQADLSPLPPRVVGRKRGDDEKQSEQLQPIILTEKASKKWGTTQLPRYKGLGQVAEPGFNNNQWMDGQLIIIGDEYFSFAWVPIEQQIFFGRPSPELALKMLRSTGATVASKTWEDPPSPNDDVSVLKDYVASCLEKTTETFEDEVHGNALSGIWHGVDTEECYFQ